MSASRGFRRPICPWGWAGPRSTLIQVILLKLGALSNCFHDSGSRLNIDTALQRHMSQVPQSPDGKTYFSGKQCKQTPSRASKISVNLEKVTWRTPARIALRNKSWLTDSFTRRVFHSCLWFERSRCSLSIGRVGNVRMRKIW